MRAIALGPRVGAAASAMRNAGGSVRTLFGQAFDVGEIRAFNREAAGSRDSQWARENKLIPGIVYGYSGAGVDAAQKVYVNDADLRREVVKRGQSFYNTLFDVWVAAAAAEVSNSPRAKVTRLLNQLDPSVGPVLIHCCRVLEDGTRERVLPRDFQIHPFRPKAICINWLRYRVNSYPGTLINIPLRAMNEERCPGIKEGGWLLPLNHFLTVYATGERIPDCLLMDLRGLKGGDKIMASHVELNDGLRLHSKVKDFAVARIMGSRRSAEDDAADAKEGGGAAPAKAKVVAKPDGKAAAAPKDGGDKPAGGKK